MHKTILYGFVLLCITLVSFLAITPGDRQITTVNDTQGGSGDPFVPVAVENFPATQSVSGTVQVGNFHQTVTVQGTVEVGNLPLDERGDLRMGGTLTLLPAQPHFVGINEANFTEILILDGNRGCSFEFPGTRLCAPGELLVSIPPPPEWTGRVFVYGSGLSAACIEPRGGGASCGFDPHPLICCGY